MPSSNNQNNHQSKLINNSKTIKELSKNITEQIIDLSRTEHGFKGQQNKSEEPSGASPLDLTKPKSLSNNNNINIKKSELEIQLEKIPKHLAHQLAATQLNQQMSISFPSIGINPATIQHPPSGLPTGLYPTGNNGVSPILLPNFSYNQLNQFANPFIPSLINNLTAQNQLDLNQLQLNHHQFGAINDQKKMLEQNFNLISSNERSSTKSHDDKSNDGMQVNNTGNDGVVTCQSKNYSKIFITIQNIINLF